MFENLFKPKIIEKTIYKEPEIREGWFVWEAGQDPVCCYWYCILFSFKFKDKNGCSLSVEVNDCETFSKAIDEANKEAEKAELKANRS